MIFQTLTALLERLEKAGAALEKGFADSWFLKFDGQSLEVLSTVYMSGRAKALLLGWAMQEIEALGCTRGVQFYKDGGPICEVTVQHADSYVATPHQAPTELQATLEALAEILESKK